MYKRSFNELQGPMPKAADSKAGLDRTACFRHITLNGALFHSVYHQTGDGFFPDCAVLGSFGHDAIAVRATSSNAF